MINHLFSIAHFAKESDLFSYDSYALSEDETTLGIGFINNQKASIICKIFEDQIQVSFHKNIGAYEGLKFFIEVLEKIQTKIVIVNDFA